MKGTPSLSAPVRVQPFTGLVIDVDTWATAHDYHRRHHQLHLLTLHGSGIASGLDVVPTDPPSEALVIEAGVAIDDGGNVIVVPEAQRVTLEAKAHTQFIVLDYIESLPPTAGVNGTETRGRMVEDFRLRVLAALPESHALELGRVRVAPGEKLAFTAAANPAATGDNEIDGRFRPLLHPRAPARLSVGLIVAGGLDSMDATHLRGFTNLMREMRARGVVGTLVGGGDDEAPQADMLYVTGKGSAGLAKPVVDGIGEQLKRGAWLFADACGPGTELIEALKPALKDDKKSAAETEARVLNATYVFGEAPKGASSTQELIWGRRAVVSPRDFGCAWSGRHGNQTLTREQIRSALEFGVNVAVCAAEYAPG
jgi:hypothetical protein